MTGASVRLFGITSLLLCGCEKNFLPGREERGASPAVSSDAFAKGYEESKARAVAEFPDLGKAGTVMNSRFVARAKQLAEQNADELNDPNWPYLLAVKMRAELSGEGMHGIDRVFSVQDLRAMNTLPSAAVIMGRVTKFDEIGLPMGVLSVVLDDTLKCEVTMCELGSRDHFVWQRNGSSILLVRQLNRAGLGPAASLSMGQVLRVEGAFVQRGGKPVLVGTVKYN
jgi:hypothetical protein